MGSIGEIHEEQLPAGWRILRLAHFGEFRKGRGIARADITDEGVPAILYGDLYTQYELKAETLVKRTTPEVAANAEEICKGDLLLTGSGETKEDIGRCIVYLGKEKAYAGGDVIILRQNKADSLFLSYVLNSAPVVAQKTQMAKGEIVVHIYSSDLRDIVFPLPPLPEQRAIAAFLDERTARIDALVARKRRLVQLLKEKRQALITRAVTRGLDPKAKMKESGVPWLGEVPEHWEVKRIKAVVVRSENGAWGEDEAGDENDVFCYRAADFDTDRMLVTQEKLVRRNVTPDVFRRKAVRPEHLLIEKSGGGENVPVGRVVRSLLDEPAVFSNFLGLIEVDEAQADSNFMRYTFWHLYSGKVPWRSIKQTTGLQNLDTSSYFDERIALPPLPEQRAIAAFLDDRTARIDNLITKIEQAVERLQEYRTALISAAVTGKVRVPIGRSEDQMIGQ